MVSQRPNFGYKSPLAEKARQVDPPLSFFAPAERNTGWAALPLFFLQFCYVTLPLFRIRMCFGLVKEVELKRKEGRKVGKMEGGGAWPVRVTAPTSATPRWAVVVRWCGGGKTLKERYLVDPASSHMLVSKIKPCIFKSKPHLGGF